jgi:ribosomal-protein-alanine N-acetyltransferase
MRHEAASLRLKTKRLELIAATADLLRAEISDQDRFARLLEARVHPAWAQELDYQELMGSMAQRLEDAPAETGWWSWYFVLRNRLTGSRVLIGNGGFKGPPDEEGSVEIGYSVLPPHRSKGYTTEAVQALVSWAFEHSEVARVIAEARPGNLASVRVLQKVGFSEVGPGLQRNHIRFDMARQDFVS